MEKSVTRQIQRLKEGDRQVVEELWKGYFPRVVGFARTILGPHPHPSSSEEDVALSAFKSLVLAAENGRFPKLEDRDDLWELLAMITRRKVADKRQYDCAQKRDSRREVSGDDQDGNPLLWQAESEEIDPALAAEMADEIREFLELLDNKNHKIVVLLKLQGYKHSEIAKEIGRSVTSVERYLDIIRDRWRNRYADDGHHVC